MSFIAGDDVAALQHQADDRAIAGLLAEIAAAGIPIQIFLEIFKHPRCQRVPDAQVGEHLGLGHNHGGAVCRFSGAAPGEDVLVGQHQ